VTIDPALAAVLSQEARLLLLTAGGAANDAALAGALRGPVDWAKLSWLAEWERATSVVWRRLSALGRDRLPEDVSQAWERLAMVADFHSVYLSDRFGETLRALADGGVQVVLLKGAALAHSAYRGFTERPMGDVDLLIDPTQVRKAWRIVSEAGWTWDRTAFPDVNYEGHHHLPPLLDGQRTGAKLEIHTALSVFGHPFALGFDAVRRTARQIEVAGCEAYVLDEVQQVVHLSVHFAWSHMLSFGAWRVFRDLWALTQTGRVDWDAVPALSRKHGATSCCYWTMRLAGRLAGVETSSSAMAKMRAPTPPGLRQLVERHLATQLFATERACPSEAVRRWMWSAAIRPGRLRLGEGRPWDLDAMPASTTRGPGAAVGRRVAYHLENFMRWVNYLRIVGVPRRA
jgi:hypothetical protein